MARKHKFDKETGACVGCGLREVEHFSFMANLCGGNPVVARIGRKLLALAESRMGPVFYNGSEKCRPYHTRVQWYSLRKKDLADLAALLVAKVNRTERVREAVKGKPTIAGLLRGAAKDPIVYGMIADALEESGCEDTDLLEALRTP